MHGIIPYKFDFWANPVVHLLLLKSSMSELVVPEHRLVPRGSKDTLSSWTELKIICQKLRDLFCIEERNLV